MKNKTGLTVIILVISGCALISVLIIIGGILLFKAQKAFISPTVTTAPTQTLAPGVTPSGTSVAGDGTISPDIVSQMDEIQKQVEEIRGLSLKTDLKRALLTPAELKDKVINDFFADYTAADEAKDLKILSTFGLLEPNFNLHQFYIDLYSEQIAGYYDSKTKDMYVIAGGTFGGMERMTYSHEFTHALQDQNYDLENGLKLNQDYCKNDTEYCAAASALIEGDATLTEQFWFIQHSTRQDQKDLAAFQKSYKSPVYDSAPAFMKEDFLFPYSQGLTFVQGLQEKGGWQAVDNALKDPPVSTEQILHPEKYPADKPVVVDVPDLPSVLGSGWEEIDRNVMGEWYSYLILADGISSQFQMNADKAKTATAGWGGDTYVFASKTGSDEYLLTWHSNWETAADAGEFFALSHDYGMARWGAPSFNNTTSVTWESTANGTITMRQNGVDVLWLMGSSDADISLALSALKDFGN